jgi:hemerythrin
MRRSADLRAFLDATNLFSEGLPVAALGRIADAATERSFRPGETVAGGDLEVLSVLRYGRVERSVGGTVLDVLQARDFFGEEGAIFKLPYLSHLRALEETAVIQIPGELLAGVPIVRWKLFERYQQRVARIIYDGDRSGNFTWRDSFSIEVAQMDSHHKRLIEIGNAIMEHLHGEADRGSLAKAFAALVDYTHYHFSAEEQLMALYDYPGAQGHRNEHRDLALQVAEYQQRVLGGDVPDKAGFLRFFESWVVRHILSEDRKYGAFLNAKGVY